ncbi:MAG TPA: hypothetical protein VM347_37655 [Nonomuraea sp.]|nr:hypothetical protein [Nonomuraea sp.]
MARRWGRFGRQVIRDSTVGRDVYLVQATGDVTVGTEHRVPGSIYLQQVRRIAPDTLHGREAELAELAQSCGPDEPAWTWWQAPAWSGKSALMSWFVLHPPPGTRVVSFFVTARWAGHSDRNAFVEALLDQLAEVARQPVPAFLAEVHREPLLLSLLEEAARVCGSEGRRLVLVLDGLDEDRGVTVGSDAHSIAAVLPVRLPQGVTVIVAGRPDPPIPADVPDEHPLRDPGVVRLLPPSAYARIVRSDAQRELKCLLHGSRLEQDLLALVTAAGGGLSAADLAELTDRARSEIEEHLQAATGRTFSGRPVPDQPEHAAVVYVLAHEELQVASINALGDVRLAACRERIHRWADTYRARRWPEETPDYLLRGYVAMLQAHGDTRRLVALAEDTDRHERLLVLTGADASALAEISAAQDAVTSSRLADLAALLRLSIARNELTVRNQQTPYRLPGTWALLGHPDRAEALARSIPDPQRRLAALVDLAVVLTELGEFERVERIIGQAGTTARLFDFSLPKRDGFGQLVRALLAASRPDLAEAAALSVDHHDVRLDLWSEVAAAGQAGRIAHEISTASPDKATRRGPALVRALAAAGDFAKARTYIEADPDPWARSTGLVLLAEGLAAAGLDDQAAEVVASAANPYWRIRSLNVVATALAKTGRADRALDIAMSAVDEFRRSDVSTDYRRDGMLLGLIEALVAGGGFAEAMSFAEEEVSQGDPTSEALFVIATALAANGRYDEAERLATSLEIQRLRDQALAQIIRGWIARSERERALAVARLSYNWHSPGHQAAEIARTHALLGEHAQARELAHEAWRLGRPLVPPGALFHVAAALARAGRSDLTSDLADALAPQDRSQVILFLVSNAATVGDDQRAEELAGALRVGSDRNDALVARILALIDHGRLVPAGRLAQDVTGPGRVTVLTALARAWVAEDDTATAQTFLQAAREEHTTAPLRGLVELAKAEMTLGDYTRACELIDTASARAAEETLPEIQPTESFITFLTESGAVEQAEKLLEQPGSANDRRARRAFAHALARIGRTDRAKRIAKSLSDASLLAGAFRIADLADLARVLLETGAFDVARPLVMEIDRLLPHRATVIYDCWQYVNAIVCLAALGNPDRAESLALALSDPYPASDALVAAAAWVPPDRALRFLTLALAQGPYWIPLDLMAALTPDSLRGVADWLLNRPASPPAPWSA